LGVGRSNFLNTSSGKMKFAEIQDYVK
jgi:hypothetical protein